MGEGAGGEEQRLTRQLRLTCVCERSFKGVTEAESWRLLQAHLAEHAADDDPLAHFIAASTYVKGTESIPEEPRDLEALVRWLANTVHQAHHTEQVRGWQECPRPTCVEARRGLGMKI